MIKDCLRVYLVTDRSLSLGRDLCSVVSSAVEGGVTMVQLREKDCSSREFYELAVSMKECLKPYGIPLIINDRVDIALACDADGVHIGQSDLPYRAARNLLGPDKIIGLSVENIEDALRANEVDVDYIGISPVYATPTKTDTAPALGLEGVRRIMSVTRHPAVGIGGINFSTAEEVLNAGVDGLSVVSAIMSSPDPAKAARHLSDIVKAHLSNQCL